MDSAAADPVSVRVVRLDHGRGLPLPERASEGSAGLDLRAALVEALTLEPGERELVPTGLVLEIPAGWEGQIRPRSGLAVRHGLTVLNAPGTVDSDYRGEVRVLLVNHGREPIVLRRGDRVAQLVISRVAPVELLEAENLEPTRRGGGGFGSTGVD